MLLNRINKNIMKFEKVLVVVGLIVLIGTVFLAAVLRYFGIDMSISTDLAQLVFAWTSFIGASLAIRTNSHMGMDFIVNKLTPRSQSKVKIFCNLLMLLFLVIIIIYGFRLTFANLDRKYNTLGISYSFATVSCPIGSLMMLTGTLNNLINEIKKLGKE